MQAKLRKEVIEVLGNDPVDFIPTLEELRRMEYLNMVIKEVNNEPEIKHMMCNNFCRIFVCTDLLIQSFREKQLKTLPSQEPLYLKEHYSTLTSVVFTVTHMSGKILRSLFPSALDLMENKEIIQVSHGYLSVVVLVNVLG